MKILSRLFLQIFFLASILIGAKGYALDAYIRGGDFSSYLSETDHYIRKVQPILDKRCVVCHSCFEAPCQLKLTSYEMLERGANQHPSNGGIFSAAPRTDLDYTKKQQEDHDFYPVANGKNSIMLNLLLEGRYQGDLPKQTYLENNEFQCVNSVNKLKSLDLSTQKSIGMPYYMSPIPDNEYQILVSWLANGATPPLSSVIESLSKPKNPKAIQEWEDFFNTPTWKGRWTSRYLYEHLFTAHLYIENSPGEFYELVRSYNPAPMKIDIIPTERPFSMKQGYENRFYYRLKKVTSTILDKQHFVYSINAEIMNELKRNFWNSKWEGNSTIYPFSFKDANPFVAFKHIPAVVRYRWMLKNSKMLLDMDMRSDNCHGRGATGPLRDNFLVIFLKPESDVTAVGENFFDKANPYLDMANTKGTGIGKDAANLKMNLTFSSQQEKYSEVKNAYQKKLLKDGLKFEDIWDGEKGTQTPIYTILRHDKTVSVHEGQWGPVSRITLLWDYVSFERLYYNCVALTTLYDSVNDKAGTVTYLRKVGREVEEQFLSFFPENSRKKIRAEWLQGLGAKQDYDTSKFSLPFNESNFLRKGFLFNKNKPYTSFMTYLFLQSGVYSKKSVGTHFYPTSFDTAEYASLKEASVFMSTEQVAGEGNRGTHFPNISYIAVKDRDKKMHYYTIIVNRFFEYVNVIDMMGLGKKIESGRVPKNDSMLIFESIVANYPTKIYRLNQEELPRFIERMKQVNSREDYVSFDKDFGLQKLSKEFWPLIDKIQSHYIQDDIIRNGQLDLVDYGNHDLLGQQ